jgi:hypothetical protein
VYDEALQIRDNMYVFMFISRFQRPIVNDFEVRSRIGLKSVEKSTKFREEGNRLFQADQTPQAILFYNKSLVFAPHPDYEEYTWPTGM